ncbi:MAG TPA: RNA 2',3'-cyclic phosphodiesterase [Holophagaceae bacterium]|nr:RNA 2',3'-cyclic phosphodiesterase [Holophagaceae bacterium]
MRLFFSLPLPPEPQARLQTWMGAQGLLREGLPLQLHLTVAFLGEVAPELALTAARCGAESAARHGAFALTSGPVGTFPRRHGAQVVFLEVAPLAPLVALAEDLRQRLGVAGVPADPKPFHPHLTLARLPSGRPLPEAPPAETWTVDRLHLVESRLSVDGARHESRFAWSLARA